MSTYALMRALESAPKLYDLGIRALGLGAIGGVYDRLAGHVGPGERVLDIGCGTGALTLRLARRGARVKGVDINPGMLEVARRRVREAGFEDKVELAEMGVAELDAEPAESYDAVASGLCLSELSDDELSYALDQVARVLKPGGLFLIADEVALPGTLRRAFRTLVRLPLACLSYLLGQRRSHVLRGLPARLEAAGLHVQSITERGLSGLTEVTARKPGEHRR